MYANPGTPTPPDNSSWPIARTTAGKRLLEKGVQDQLELHMYGVAMYVYSIFQRIPAVLAIDQLELSGGVYRGAATAPPWPPQRDGMGLAVLKSENTDEKPVRPQRRNFLCTYKDFLYTYKVRDFTSAPRVCSSKTRTTF